MVQLISKTVPITLGIRTIELEFNKGQDLNIAAAALKKRDPGLTVTVSQKDGIIISGDESLKNKVTSDIIPYYRNNNLMGYYEQVLNEAGLIATVKD